MTGTRTTLVKDRVTAVLARHFEAGAFYVVEATGGTAAFVTGKDDRARLGQFTATLREAGLVVADHAPQGHLYVFETGPAHAVAMAREIAGSCRAGYAVHVREHGPDGAEPAEKFDTSQGGGFTVEREGHLYDVTVVPREQARP